VPQHFDSSAMRNSLSIAHRRSDSYASAVRVEQQGVALCRGFREFEDFIPMARVVTRGTAHLAKVTLRTWIEWAVLRRDIENLHQRSTDALRRYPLTVFIVPWMARNFGASQAQAKVSDRTPLTASDPTDRLFIADPDGPERKALLPARRLDYNAHFPLTVDGSSSHRSVLLGGYLRVHPDGSGLERLTSDPPTKTKRTSQTLDPCVCLHARKRGGGYLVTGPATHKIPQSANRPPIFVPVVARTVMGSHSLRP